MKNTILTLIVSLFIISGANAEYVIYDNVADFEANKGAICEAATDGCNNYFMTDGKVMGGTRMFCENHKVEWTCTKYKENSISTMSILDEAILYDEIQTTGNTLSENDQNFYDTINNRLANKHKVQVQSALNKYQVILENRVNHTEEELKEKLLKRVENKISELLLQYPADSSLPEDVNNVYLSLTMFKFELMMR